MPVSEEGTEKGVIAIKNQALTQKEILFCCYFAELCSVKESAVRAGFSEDEAYLKGIDILHNRKALREIKKHRELLFPDGESSALTALRRIVFFDEKEMSRAVLTEDTAGFDSFSVNEIKKIKGGGTEIKLVNKLDAVRLLYEIEEGTRKSSGVQNFFSALTMGKPKPDGDENEL